jgi:hypothetical protein
MESCNLEAKANEENSSMLVSSTHLPPTKYSDNGERLRDFCGECSDPFFKHFDSFVPNIFATFYSVKNHKITNNSATTEAKEKNKDRCGIFILLGTF